MNASLSLGHRFWRSLPVEPRRAGLSMVARALAPRADPVPPAGPDGLVIAGEMTQGTGLGEAARIFAKAARRLGVARGTMELGIGRRPRGEAAAGAALLLAVNAPSIPLMLARAGDEFLRGRLVIGAWAWELPVAPDHWRRGARYVHEIWAGSVFAAAALERLMPGCVRHVPYPLGLLHDPWPAAHRASFGLPEGAVVTVMVFSLGSSLGRKNPLAAIQAFRRAFHDRTDQILVVKIAGAAAFPRAAAMLAAQAGGNIRVFAQDWPAGRVEALLACADIVLSLHRAEGFGLVLAQAMLHGIPVVATGWSGNLAFMDGASAALVGYRLVPVRDEAGIYAAGPGTVWAEPDIAHAAELLRALGDDGARRAALGARGRGYAASALNGDEFRAAIAALNVAECEYE